MPLTLGEEYGWRGYLLPLLLPVGGIKATLILALIWAMWHLPIPLIGLNYPEQSLTNVLPVFTITVVLTAVVVIVYGARRYGGPRYES